MRLLPVIGDSDVASFPGESRTYWKASGLPGIWDLVMCYSADMQLSCLPAFLEEFYCSWITYSAHFLQSSVTSDILCTHMEEKCRIQIKCALTTFIHYFLTHLKMNICKNSNLRDIKAISRKLKQCTKYLCEMIICFELTDKILCFWRKLLDKI